MLYPYINWNQTIAGLTCPSDTRPAIAVDSAENVYFAFATSSAIGTLPASTTGLQIVVGSYSSAGVLRWLLRDPQLVANANATIPSLTVGSAGELYLGFQTTGAVAGKVNMFDTFSFCGSCGGASAGRWDIVVARIDGAASGSPTVSWVIQDASIDSCNNEQSPALVFDSAGSRLLVSYTCSGAVVCGAPVSSTQNIVVTALDSTTGGLLWNFQSDLLNCTTNNQSPAITVDSAGNIYVANIISSAVVGGQFSGTTFVEVIRFHQEGSPVQLVRDWILSSVVTINPPTGAASQPTLQVDSARGRLLIGYLTTGVIAGGNVRPGSLRNPVFAAVSTETGALQWIKQSAIYNPSPFAYTLADSLTSALDDVGNFYAAFRIDAGTENAVVVFRIGADNGEPVWSYQTTLSQVYRGYLPAYSSTTSPNTIVRNTGYRSGSVLGIRRNQLYMAFMDRATSSSTAGDFYLAAGGQLERWRDLTAFEYMDQETGICGEL